ncbi:hypothetical protein EVAR_91541_1 [Eumeta japonica]|uniref:Uncharacterized protein n=1 Tax=Eumeta variegata TaxID=151549 RepID=A0A4C1VBJ2_EUMVA|nr:hypothetical protein EVAR_91541_1 [Eumeta japonica]
MKDFIHLTHTDAEACPNLLIGAVVNWALLRSACPSVRVWLFATTGVSFYTYSNLIEFDLMKTPFSKCELDAFVKPISFGSCLARSVDIEDGKYFAFKRTELRANASQNVNSVIKVNDIDRVHMPATPPSDASRMNRLTLGLRPRG